MAEGDDNQTTGSKIFNASTKAAAGTTRTAFSLLTNDTASLGDALNGLGDVLRATGANFDGLSGAAFKSIEIIARVGAGVIKLSDNLAKLQQGMLKTTFAAHSLGEVTKNLGSLQNQMAEGMITTQRATGESKDVILAQFDALGKVSGKLSLGYDEIAASGRSSMSALAAQSAQLDLTNKMMLVSSISGVEYSETLDHIKNANQKLGESGETALDSFAFLKTSIEGTGLTMQSGLKHVNSMVDSFKMLGISSKDAATSIGFAVKKQQEMAEGGRYTFVSQEQAAESMGNVMKGVASATQDLGKALFFTGAQGGGMKEAFEFMYDDTDPTKKLATMMSSIAKVTTGGDLITKEEAQATRNYEQFAAQQKVIQKQLGLATPQEAAKATGILEQVGEGGISADQAMQELKDLQKSEKDLLGDLTITAKKTLPGIFDSTKQLNSTLASARMGLMEVSRESVGKPLNKLLAGQSENIDDATSNVKGVLDSLGLDTEAKNELQGAISNLKSGEKMTPEAYMEKTGETDKKVATEKVSEIDTALERLGSAQKEAVTPLAAQLSGIGKHAADAVRDIQAKTEEGKEINLKDYFENMQESAKEGSTEQKEATAALQVLEAEGDKARPLGTKSDPLHIAGMEQGSSWFGGDDDKATGSKFTGTSLLGRPDEDAVKPEKTGLSSADEFAKKYDLNKIQTKKLSDSLSKEKPKEDNSIKYKSSDGGFTGASPSSGKGTAMTMAHQPSGGPQIDGGVFEEATRHTEADFSLMQKKQMSGKDFAAKSRAAAGKKAFQQQKILQLMAAAEGPGKTVEQVEARSSAQNKLKQLEAKPGSDQAKQVEQLRELQRLAAGKGKGAMQAKQSLAKIGQSAKKEEARKTAAAKEKDVNVNVESVVKFTADQEGFMRFLRPEVVKVVKDTTTPHHKKN